MALWVDVASTKRHTRGTMPISITVKLALLAALVIFIVVVIDLVGNQVALPMWNLRWVARDKRKCSTLNPVVVVLGCYGSIDDTVSQISTILQASSCPTSLRFAVVPMSMESVSPAQIRAALITKLRQHACFKGHLRKFQQLVQLHVTDACTGGGNILAMGIGVSEARDAFADAEFVSYMAPNVRPETRWNKTAMDELERCEQMLVNGRHPALTYGVTGLNMSRPTFSVLSCASGVPFIGWTDLPACDQPQFGKLVSSDFVFARLAHFPTVISREVRGIADAPACADVALTVMLHDANVELMHPSKLLVTGRRSQNMDLYKTQLRVGADTAHRNRESMDRVIDFLKAERNAAHLRDVIGIDMHQGKATIDGVMGLLSPAHMDRLVLPNSGSDLALKYKTHEHALAVLHKVVQSVDIVRVPRESLSLGAVAVSNNRH